MSLNVVYPIHLSAPSALSVQQKKFEQVVQSIATGINSQVNPADKYVSTGLDTSIRSAKQAINNAQSGYNFTLTADTALESISRNLQRVRELSVQASNGIYSASQVSSMQGEIDQYMNQITQTLNNATFNGKSTLNAITPQNLTAAPVVDFMVGTNSSSIVSYDPNFNLGVMNFDVSTPQAANATLAQVDSILNNIGSKRGEIGAVQTSLEGAIAQQSSNIMSIASSLSGMQDTDYISAISELKQSEYTMEAMVKVMKAVMNSQDYVLDLLKQ